MRRGTSALAIALIALVATPSVAAAYLTGIGDENWTMFKSPYYTALHSPITRYIIPYDAIDTQRGETAAWIHAAEAQGQQVLVAFYHSRRSATRMPTVARYTLELRRFMAVFPEIKLYSPWNEANRGNVRIRGGGSFDSPTASQSANYYLALLKICPKCTVVGLDVLDSQSVSSTINYVHTFQRLVRRHPPKIWGLHNYTDTNRFHSTGTRAFLRAVKGQVWLTETGGLVQLGGVFSNRKGSGLKRASKALTYMFRLASSNPRITRLYIYSWFGG